MDEVIDQFDLPKNKYILDKLKMKQGTRCEICGSNNISEECTGRGDYISYYKLKCNTCGATWTIRRIKD